MKTFLSGPDAFVPKRLTAMFPPDKGSLCGHIDWSFVVPAKLYWRMSHIITWRLIHGMMETRVCLSALWDRFFEVIRRRSPFLQPGFLAKHLHAN